MLWGFESPLAHPLLRARARARARESCERESCACSWSVNRARARESWSVRVLVERESCACSWSVNRARARESWSEPHTFRSPWRAGVAKDRSGSPMLPGGGGGDVPCVPTGSDAGGRGAVGVICSGAPAGAASAGAVSEGTAGAVSAGCSIGGSAAPVASVGVGSTAFLASSSWMRWMASSMSEPELWIAGAAVDREGDARDHEHQCDERRGAAEEVALRARSVHLIAGPAPECRGDVALPWLDQDDQHQPDAEEDVEDGHEDLQAHLC